MSHVTTHVLDTSRGRPAAGIEVALGEKTADGWRTLASGTTDADGRIGDLGPERLASGHYRLLFAVAPYLESGPAHEPAFFTEVAIAFRVDEAEAHYHVPLLLSPYGYSTYRGS